MNKKRDTKKEKIKNQKYSDQNTNDKNISSNETKNFIKSKSKNPK